jgi:hypothetical protein
MPYPTTSERFDPKKSINSNFVKNKQEQSKAYLAHQTGRKRGTKNVVNQSMREIVHDFVLKNVSSAQVLYDRVAKKEPAKALQILTNLCDFVLPRLARTEMTVAGDPLVSPNPIADAGEAAAVYASILGNTKFNLSVITFAPPAQESVVAQQGQVPSGPRPPDNVVGIFEKLGKE